MSNTRLHESGTLVESKGNAGVFRARIITEGKGSSGIYSRDLLQRSASVFENVPSFMNHPLDPERPDLRDITSIAAKVSNVEYAEVDGVAGLYGDIKVDQRWESFVRDYADVIGLSIYVEGSGRKNENNELIVESLSGDDPYRSVDFVVAAGRGGRIERAMESWRAIESSVGEPSDKPSSEASGQDNKKDKMDKEILEALNGLTEALKPVIAFVNESQNASKSALQAEVDAEAVETAVAERLSAYDEKVKQIESAELLPSQVESIRSAALRGEDVAPLIVEAKKVLEEAKGFRSSESLRVGDDRLVEDYTMIGVRL